MLKAAYWSTDLPRDMAEAVRCARRAVALDSTDARVLSSSGWVFAFVAGRLEEGANLLEQALARDPNLFTARTVRGWVAVMLGEDSACERFERTLRLNPLDSAVYTVEAGLAHGHFLAGRYADAVSWATKALRQVPDYAPALNALMASQAMAGHVDEARRLWAGRPETLRTLRLSNLTDWFPAKPEVLERYAPAFRLAGVPE